MRRFSALFVILFLLVSVVGLAQAKKKVAVKSKTMAVKRPFVWEGANLYFLMTDRFKNGDATNDHTYNRTKPAAKLRGFDGGDLRGVIQKIDDGYFDKLGINAIWLSPIVEQIHAGVDEGTGYSYGFHGYWTRDWSSIDASFGNKKDLAELVAKAHAQGIRVVLDAVINHTGPVTPEDSVYPSDWVRTAPKCTYKSYDTYINCTLVDNLPDIKTESNEAVAVPPFLIAKWKKEGRYDKEMASLDAFFAKTKYPRAPRFYIMKWLSDYIREYGIDGYRVDTAKHTGETVWSEFRTVCDAAFADYKKKFPGRVVDQNPFFIVGEVYGYNIGNKKLYDFGDKKVDYFEHGFTSLINFDFRNEAKMAYEPLFSKYSDILNNDLKGHTVMNYVSSHDDNSPYDKKRERPMEAGTKLLLAPGISQVYYGDETARPLEIPGAEGDANLRSPMNWEDLKSTQTQKVLAHWQKLGKFRRNHISVGAGVHKQLSATPYVFSRSYAKGKIKDAVVVGLDLSLGLKSIPVAGVFENGVKVRDAYSGKTFVVAGGKVVVDSGFGVVLLERM